MRIAIGNQKGGVGKTTLSILFCNYLYSILNKNVIAVDLDPQESFFDKWESDKELFKGSTYDLLNIKEKEYKSLVELLTILPEENYILIDLPGYMINDKIMKIIDNIDVMIIPFDYTQLCVESTLIYTQVLRELQPNMKICFVPNKIKINGKYDLMDQVDNVLNKFGFISPRIKDSIQFTRINTLSIPDKVKGELLFVLNKIYSYVEE